jgi:hypothetical protein
MNGYYRLKALAASVGVRVPDLLAMSRTNDPFYCGSPADIANAQWFAGLFDEHGFAAGVHLRRIQYRLVSQADPVQMPNGAPYENTERCWDFLCTAGKAVRTLGLVDVQSFVDQRNAPPQVFRDSGFDDEPSVGISEWRVSLPQLFYPNEPRIERPETGVYGYGYSGADQPFLIEVWVEKSTMNDILAPICREFGANLVISAGFQSITSAVNLIKRTQAADRPARVFYISDFDPAGDKMPQSVARQVEYWVGQYEIDADIALTPLALTATQVEQFDLPRIPIKDSDRRAAGFEARRGEGAVELDALEALHPGELRELVRHAIEEFFDPDLEAAADLLAFTVDKDVGARWEAETADERAALAEIERQAAAVYESFGPRMKALRDEAESDLEPLRERLAEVEARLWERWREFDPDLPDRAESDIEPDDSAWLFKSDRDYSTQLRSYREASQ